MYSKDLNNMIDGLLEKGHLTDRERALLVKRAVAEGNDPEEFENYLDSKIEERYSTDPVKRLKRESRNVKTNIKEFFYLDFFERLGILGIILWVILLPLILIWRLICIIFGMVF